MDEVAEYMEVVGVIEQGEINGVRWWNMISFGDP